MTLDLGFLQTLSHRLGWAEYYFWHVVGFIFTYFLLSEMVRRLVKDFLVKRGFGSYIEKSPLKPGQIRWEIRHAMSSILFLSFFAVLALKLEQYGYLTIHWSGITWIQVTFDLSLFAIWNEIYFFCCHYLLHRPWFFKKVHIIHHHSVTVTPYSSLSFHWFEAFLVSGTMLSIQLIHGFNILAIMLWPAISLICNTFGHSNFSFHSSQRGSRFLENNWRHNLHHTKVSKNFAFWTPWPDTLLLFLTKRTSKATVKSKADS